MVPHDMEGAKMQRLEANKVFNDEMVQKVKEYQIKKAEDLEEAKRKVIAKHKKDERRYAMELKQRDEEIKRKN